MNPPEPYEGVALDKATCLVVDDDATISRAVGNMLRRDGATVYTAASGDEALQWMDGHAVDLVVTDLKMDGMDGLELTATIKQRNSSISVVVMSSHAAPDYAAKATSCGAAAYLRKPFNAETCIGVVRRALIEKASGDVDHTLV